MTVARLLAITPLTDITTWLRGRGFEIVLPVLGAVLLARFVTWCGRRITRVQPGRVGGRARGATATIEEVALRTTRLRTTRLRTLTGDVVTVPNGEIVQVTNLSSDRARAVVDVPLPVGVDVPRANAPPHGGPDPAERPGADLDHRRDDRDPGAPQTTVGP